MTSQSVHCKSSANSTSWKMDTECTNETAHSYSESKLLVRALMKGITIASAATVVLPVVLLLVLNLVTGQGALMDAMFSVSQFGGDLLSVLLVLNFVLVFLGLSIPEITRISQK